MSKFPFHKIPIGKIGGKYKRTIGLSLLFLLGVFYYQHSVFDYIPANVVQKNYNLPIYSVETNEKEISLTFDAAWGDEDLDDILAILKKQEVKATFFVTGDWISTYPEAIQKIQKAGHDLGSHGDNHKHMTRLSVEENQKELKGCYDKMKALTGIEMDLFRAPYGDYNETLVDTAKKEGYQVIQWDVDSLDWKDYGVESIIKTVVEHKQLRNGSIILLHNGSKYTKDALDQTIAGLKEKGYCMVPVSELLHKKEQYIDHTGRQYGY